jgi:hypothetical protein
VIDLDEKATTPHCSRCNFGEPHFGGICLGCQVVLKQDRILELERQYIVDTHGLEQERNRLRRELRNFLAAFDGYFELRGRVNSPQKVDDAKQAMFSAAMSARAVAAEAAERSEGGTQSTEQNYSTPAPAVAEDEP